MLTKALGRIKFKEMKDLVGVLDIEEVNFKFKGENVGDKHKDNIKLSYTNPNEYRNGEKKEICVPNEFRKYSLYIKSCKSVAYLCEFKSIVIEELKVFECFLKRD